MQTDSKPIGFTLTNEASEDKAVKFTAANLNKAIGQIMRIERKKRGLSQEAVAARIGVAYQQMHKYESGVNALCAFRLMQVASIFGVSIMDIFTQAAGAIVAPEDETEAEVYSAMRYLRLTTPHQLKAVMGLLRAI